MVHFSNRKHSIEIIVHIEVVLHVHPAMAKALNSYCMNNGDTFGVLLQSFAKVAVQLSTISTSPGDICLDMGSVVVLAYSIFYHFQSWQSLDLPAN